MNILIPCLVCMMVMIIVVVLLCINLSSKKYKIKELETELFNCKLEATRIAQLENDLTEKQFLLGEQRNENTELHKINGVLEERCLAFAKLIEANKSNEERIEERLKLQFENFSSKILEENREKMNKFNAEKMVDIMKPLEKDIKEFKDQMSIVNRAQTKERLELELRIKEMVEISEGMCADAQKLTNALLGNNKAAGNWGETILENILQNSGLIEGKEGYELQNMLRDLEGNAYRNDTGNKMIPDAIVHFPDKRNVIIDSKVSIVAYTEYCNASSDEEKQLHLKRHLDSIKSHIAELNVKSYENYVDGSLDFVMMFIPNDYAAMLALQEDLNLWQNAYNKKILIISPTNLITSLKIVSDLWSREKQHQNIETILKRGQLLYEKCTTFVDSFKKIGDGLGALAAIYDSASNQLGEKSGVIRQAEMLVELGVKSKKTLSLKSHEKETKNDE